MSDVHEFEDSVTVLVTGFGEFLNVKTNPSGELLSLLPAILTSPTHSHVPIRILTPPPLKAVYSSLLTTVQPLLEKHSPEFTIHIGLAVERSYFAIEKGAERDGYHQIPDEERKVVSKAEGKKLWGKSPTRLDSAIDVDRVVDRWKGILERGNRKSGGKKVDRGKGIDVRASDDVGNYVCGFLYYSSLRWLWERKKEGRVLFLHVPFLKEREELEWGREVTVALIQAIVEDFT